MAQIHFGLLGPLRAERDGGELSLGAAKQRAVLGVLLLGAGRAVSRDEIIAGVWGEHAPTSAANLVATYVVGLRRALEPDEVIESVPGAGYRLRDGSYVTDLQLFEADAVRARQARDGGSLDGSAVFFETALSWWRGTALDGVPGPCAEQARLDLAERRQAVVEERIEVNLARGRYAECVLELAALVEAHPLREPLHRMHVLALFGAGRKAEAVAAFHRGRRIIVDELGVEPGAALRELHQRILDDDVPVLSTGVAPEPHQLPADVPGLAGRDGELAMLTDLLTDPRAGRVGVISGPAGVGKTALAVHAARRVIDRFPDGQLYLVLGPRRTPGEVLHRVLTDLGVREDRLPEDDDQRAAMVRTMLSGRRVLLVFDDVHDVTQVAPALPGDGGCAVLITSRARICTLTGARVVRLAPLDADTSADLLGRLAGRSRLASDPEVAARIVGLCGGLPRVLLDIGSWLASRPDWPVAAFLNGVAQRVSTTMQYTVDGERALVPGDAHRAFRLLGSLPGAVVHPHTAAAVLEVPFDVAERALELLTDQHLLEPAAPDGYRFTAVLQLAAQLEASRHERPTVLDALRARALDFYRWAAYQGESLWRPTRRTEAPRNRHSLSFRTAAEASHWWEGERANVTALVRATAGRPGTDPRELAALLGHLRGYLHRKGHWQDWQSLGEAVLSAGTERGDRHVEATALLELGTLAGLRDETGKAEIQLGRSIGIFRNLGDDLGVSRSLNNLAVMHNNRWRHTEAARLLNESLRLQQALGDQEGECISLDNLARLHLARKESAQAIACSRRSIRLCEENGTEYLTVVPLAVIGEAHSTAGRHAEALTHFRRAVRVARDSTNPYREAHTLFELGEAEHEAGVTGRARDSLESSLALHNELHDAVGTVRALTSLAVVLDDLGDHRGAAHRRAEAEELRRSSQPDVDPTA
ncbi:BTAD domain-containing putative transcriptional regulator [Lentzea sp. NPDC005914]|uniref:AfsR/SARP family transcriptional regulator n=1 Tax=Lentzea sp. NPDC005914 TaxID=3154572 RepID=UPI0033C649E5